MGGLSLLDLPVRRPVAVAMVFLAIALLGVVSVQRMPVELFPPLEGDTLYVQFWRANAEPAVVEREILLRLHAQASALPDVAESGGQVAGSRGNYWVRFERGSDMKVRELELRRIAAAIERAQPRNSANVAVYSTESSTSGLGSHVMTIHVSGGEDRNALFDLVRQLLVPRIAAVNGVSEAAAGGGARRQVTVQLDPRLLAATAATPEDVMWAVAGKVGHVRHVGVLDTEDGRLQVLVDGRPDGVHALREARVDADGAAKLGNVADVDFGFAPEHSVFRVNGKPAVGIFVYKEQSANLISLGKAMREKVAALREEVAPLGLELEIGEDAAELVEEQLGRLARLGLTGFPIALLVLFLFLRDWRAVAVVGLAVPVSLLGAFALLYLAGQSLNLLSLAGMSLSVGLLIDNSVVVYEAVLRRLERGVEAATAVRTGLRRTVRAIAAASLTTAIVLLPIALVDLGATERAISEILALAILLPLGASLVVAVGLVPVLAYRLAAPAARRRVAAQRAEREALGGRPPAPVRILFTGVLATALRRPSALLAVVVAAVFASMIAVPIVLSSGAPEARIADEVELIARSTKGRASIAALSAGVAEIEEAVMALDGVDVVYSEVNERGAAITAELVDEEERPPELNAASVRRAAQTAAKRSKGLEVLRPGEDRQRGRRGKGGADFGASGGGPRRILLSGPESAPLERLAQDLVRRLEALPEVSRAWRWMPPGMEELWVEPNRPVFEAFGLTLDEVLPVLEIAGREGRAVGSGFVLPSGREMPVVVERLGAREPSGLGELRDLRVHTSSGVAPVSALAAIRQMPAPPIIQHRNGRREASVFYRVDDDVAQSGVAQAALDRTIAALAQSVPRPAGYTVELEEADEQTSMMRKLAVPAILLLLLVLGMAFESLTLPLLVLLALPLTLMGAVWTLLLTGTPFTVYAGAGALLLLGLTVNPAILLVDRIQQRVRGGWSAGAAALASVRERTRPVLMTSATTIAALWPLAIETGRENEVWPPFATVVMGGLATSTVLTLLVIPVGFVLMQRLDRLFARVGPWPVVAWLAATIAAMLALTLTDVLVSLLWQVVVGLLVGGGLLAVVVMLFRDRAQPVPATSGGPPLLDVRNLKKVYGLPGPFRRALLAPREFARATAGRAGTSAGPAPAASDAVHRFGPPAVLVAAPFALSAYVQGGGWKLMLWLLGTAFALRLLAEVRRAVAKGGEGDAVAHGRAERWISHALPWLAIVVFAAATFVVPTLRGATPEVAVQWPIVGAVLLAIGQLVRSSARRQQEGRLPPRATSGPLRHPRTLLRGWARRIGGLDLPAAPVQALASVSFRVERGMVGILGPNGAGKTTLLRQLAGILDPTRGAIFLGGAPLGALRRFLARWLGYLPQDAGMPGGLSAREYLTYFAGLYDLPPDVRHGRVESLLTEVGLVEKADDPIKSLSGGQRQRVAVARTLLRLPPVIIVDEPTVGLDPRERIRFRNLLGRLAQDRIVLFSTHVVEDVAVACERVLVLAQGRLVFDGEPSALSHAADGRAWELRAPADAPFTLPPEAILAEEAPAAGNIVVRRILAETAPSPDATPSPAKLEDGYLWLISR